MIRAFSELSDDLDVMIVDTAAGIADGVVSFTQAAQHVILVVCDEPASITDAYAMIKVLSREHGVNHFRVLANMAQTAHHGRTLFNKISSVAERFLDVSLEYMGAVPFDEQLRKAVQKQGAVVENAPRSRSALAFRNLAEEAGRWPSPEGPRGNLEFFVERLLDADSRQSGGGQIA